MSLLEPQTQLLNLALNQGELLSKLLNHIEEVLRKGMLIVQNTVCPKNGIGFNHVMQVRYFSVGVRVHATVIRAVLKNWNGILSHLL